MSNRLRSISRAGAAREHKSPTPLPEAIAAEIKRAESQIAELQRQMQIGNLVRENLILSAALELGLNKKDLAALELAREADGRLVFRTPPAGKPEGKDAGKMPALPAPQP